MDAQREVDIILNHLEKNYPRFKWACIVEGSQLVVTAETRTRQKVLIWDTVSKDLDKIVGRGEETLISIATKFTKRLKESLLSGKWQSDEQEDPIEKIHIVQDNQPRILKTDKTIKEVIFGRLKRMQERGVEFTTLCWKTVASNWGVEYTTLIQCKNQFFKPKKPRLKGRSEFDQLREAVGIPIAEVIRQTGASEYRVKTWRKGTGIPFPEEMERLENLMGMSAEKMFPQISEVAANAS